MHVEYYEPCLEFDRCNELMDLYWNSKQFDRCFEGHLKLAEETHYPLAECQTGYFYWKGIGVEPNMQKALYWTNLSAIHGDWDAQCNLATFYEEGLCGEKNLEKAKYWYSRAALQEEEESVEKCRKFRISVTEKYKPDLSNVPHWHFELQQPAADHLLKLVLEGKKRATSTMQESSSIMISPPEPTIAPTAFKEAYSMGVSISEAGIHPPEGPPT